MPKITSVIGLGYLGVTQAAVLASLGHTVIGVDPDEDKVKQLNSGIVPFFEPGLDQLLQEGLSRGLLSFRGTIDDLDANVDVHFLCVGTPSKEDGTGVDTSFLSQAISQLASVLAERATIVGRSTVPVGTAAVLEDQLKGLTDKEFHLIWNPEFLSEGTAIRDSLSPERIVIGSNSPFGETTLRDVYREIIDKNVPVFVLDRQTSELVKIASNAYLALKISYINGVAQIAEKTGASTAQLADAMGLDSRIGRKFLNNGLGFGGGCLPKDLHGFAAIARETGSIHFSELLQAVDDLNTDRRSRVVEIAIELLGGLKNKKITVLGASFKPNTDDVRLSPALQVADHLRQLGAIVTIHDPIALPKVNAYYPELIQEESLEESFAGAELLILATEWSQYKNLNAENTGLLVKNKFLLDARNVFNAHYWQKAGWVIKKLGEGL